MIWICNMAKFFIILCFFCQKKVEVVGWTKTFFARCGALFSGQKINFFVKVMNALLVLTMPTSNINCEKVKSPFLSCIPDRSKNFLELFTLKPN